MTPTELSDHHKLALAHHCRLGGETVHPRFSWVPDPPRRYSVVLSVNSGYE